MNKYYFVFYNVKQLAKNNHYPVCIFGISNLGLGISDSLILKRIVGIMDCILSYKFFLFTHSINKEYQNRL